MSRPLAPRDNRWLPAIQVTSSDTYYREGQRDVRKGAYECDCTLWVETPIESSHLTFAVVWHRIPDGAVVDEERITVVGTAVVLWKYEEN